MKVLNSHQSFLLRLNTCLVLCSYSTFIGLHGCGARVIAQDNSDPKVEKVHEDLTKSSIIEVTRFNDELKREIDYVINEKKLWRIIENSGKFYKNNEKPFTKDIIFNRNVDMRKNARDDESLGTNSKNLQQKQLSRGKEFKRLIKKPITRLKRSSKNINNEDIQIVEVFGNSTETKKSENSDYLKQHPKVNTDRIRRLDINFEEEDKKEKKKLVEINLREITSEDIVKMKENPSKIIQVFGKSIGNKLSVSSDNKEENINVEGLKRLGINIDKKNERKNQESLTVKNVLCESTHNIADIDSKTNDNIQITNVKNIEHGKIQKIESPTRISDFKLKSELYKEPVIAKNSNIKNTKHASNFSQILDSEIVSNSDFNHKISNTVQSNFKKVQNKDDNIKILSSRTEGLSRLQCLKSQVLELQIKIRNSTFLQHMKKDISEIFQNIPKFTENQFLDILKTILSKKNKYQSTDFNTLKENEFSDKQIEIIKFAQQLLVQKEKQSFFNDISQCIHELNVIDCMHIFIYPLIIENMPEVLIKELSNLYSKINGADSCQGNHSRLKSTRSIINQYSNLVDPDAMIFDILMKGLLKNPPNENLPSFVDTKNESLSKFLTCNRLYLLKMTEKFLPENIRQRYSDEMLSCITRFEYYSCMKYFSWPKIKQYYTTLPQFPLSDSYLSSLIYPNYPLITFPGFENGFSQLPEVIESGSARIKPETIFMHFLKKTLKEYPRITNLPVPIQLDWIIKSQSITREQIASIHFIEHLLPINLRAEYVSKIIQCIKQIDYYNCMKYTTWPLVRQFNPTLQNFQEIINNFQLSEIPQLSNLFNYFPQFQFPQFQIPQFQLSDISTFALPDFSAFFPFGQPILTTPPTVDTSTSNITSTDNTNNNTILESKMYKILKNLTDSLRATPLSFLIHTNRKMLLFPFMTEDQSKIFALAESIVPPITRESLITSTYFCLNKRNEFSTCLKTIIWPFIKNFVKELPEFSTEDNNFLAQYRLDIPISITESADNLFIIREIEKYFSDGREDVISYIIKLIKLHKSNSLNMQKILEILRSIQFNTSEFLNMQTIQYPRDSNFSTILTEYQENIVHAVESIISEELRQIFYNDMLDCNKKNNFSVCSRNIIFPLIYQYFQKVLSVPSNITSEKNNFSQINISDINKIHPVHIETRVNTEKQGENIVINADRKFMSILPLNPDLVIFSMLRKIQVSLPRLPDFPKESIANTLKFKQVFSIRQAHILTVAETLLPEEYRKGILNEMYKCSQRDSFLNCTRDIIFPAMLKAYPDFPAFPNFEKDLNQSDVFPIIENLNKTYSFSRSYDFQRTLPFIETLYKIVPEDKSNILRILIDKLPDSLYYELYIKMIQCTQFSDVVSCSNDILYPLLKQFYNVPGFNVDKYYPMNVKLHFYPIEQAVTKDSLLDYELICENMGFVCTLIPLGLRNNEEIFNINLSPVNYESYIPFGKLSDGSRIFKHTQDIWNSNIILSVGERCPLK